MIFHDSVGQRCRQGSTGKFFFSLRCSPAILVVFSRWVQNGFTHVPGLCRNCRKAGYNYALFPLWVTQDLSTYRKCKCLQEDSTLQRWVFKDTESATISHLRIRPRNGHLITLPIFSVPKHSESPFRFKGKTQTPPNSMRRMPKNLWSPLLGENLRALWLENTFSPSCEPWGSHGTASSSGGRLLNQVQAWVRFFGFWGVVHLSLSNKL